MNNEFIPTLRERINAAKWFTMRCLPKTHPNGDYVKWDHAPPWWLMVRFLRGWTMNELCMRRALRGYNKHGLKHWWEIDRSSELVN